MLKKLSLKRKTSFVVLAAILLLGAVSFIAANSVNEVKVETSAVQGNVTLDFKDADINNVLRILAYKSGVNIVAGKEVQGLVTIRLVDVPWEKALDVVLRTYGFAYEREGNIIRVTTVENLGKETLATEVFILNYAKAKDASETLTDMLTDRGKIRYDERENMLIVTDIATNIYKIGQVVKKLDTRTPQVMIEAKIIETTLADNETLGINWNAKVTVTGSKRPTTLPFEREGQIALNNSEKSQLGKYLPRAKPTDTDFPEGEYTTSINPVFPTALKSDFTFGTLNFTEFQAVLQFLESRTKTTILSNPRITTLDNKEAQVNVTRTIPIPLYSYDTASGTRVISGYQDQKIGIKLNVTPHVNDEGYVTMTVHPEVSELTGSYVGPNNERPIYDIREATADVMVRDGETLVIGGLMKDKKSKQRTGLPFLGRIPVVGLLFSQKVDTIDKTELLIFVTPRLVHDTAERARLAAAQLQKAEAELKPVEAKEAKKEEEEKKTGPSDKQPGE